MNDKEAEIFVLDQIPIVRQSLIPSTLKTAYDAAKLYFDGEEIFKVESAKQNRGRVVAWAVDRGFEKLIESGQWPYEMAWQPFAKPTGKYLQIRMPYAVLTISQCEDPEEQPRNVKFRENLRLSPQGVLPFAEFENDRRAMGVPHIILAHGHQDLIFAQLGIPNANHGLGYIYRTRNLLLMPHEIAQTLPTVEQTDMDAVVTLKEEIDKWRRDNG